MKRCQQCTLPETFPGVAFNEQGICNYCQGFKGNGYLEARKAAIHEEFLSLIEEYRGKGTYDCLVAYSGGKDSSFLLHLLTEKYGLRLLALTMDNGFLSPQAEVNMHKVTKALRVDWVVVRPRSEMLQTIFKRSLEGPLFAAKASQRASFICLSCIGLIKFLSLRYAIELHIPFLGFGWSPGQLGYRAALMKNTPAMIRSMQHATYEPLHAIVGDEIRPYFLEEKHFRADSQFPYSVAPLVFTDYREEEIFPVIERLGWEHPKDTDANSSNCLLNALANQAHKQRFNYHPYDFELAQLVREGRLSRDEALARITSEENAVVVRQVQQQLYA
ncbi:MAG: hypothetical protein HY314_14070 [Acidobacteria bacterium]|nr:hypothetical protein [Acidobacteriota bacterium]